MPPQANIYFHVRFLAYGILLLTFVHKDIKTFYNYDMASISFAHGSYLSHKSYEKDARMLCNIFVYGSAGLALAQGKAALGPQILSNFNSYEICGFKNYNLNYLI